MSNIEMKHLTFGYGEELIFDDIDINIDDRWKLGLVGRNGRGKTTFLRLLSGNLDTNFLVNADKNFVYFPQEVMDSSQLTVHILTGLVDFEEWKLARELTLLNVDLDVLWRPFEDLSGGEQTKCLLAVLFLDEKNFPLIDEPTNHLDIESRNIVAHYLMKKSGFIVASHDRDFLDRVTDHTLAIERQKVLFYQGNFSTYEKEKIRRDEFELAEDSKLRKEISRLKETAREKENWSHKLEGTKLRKNRGFDTETKGVDKGAIGAQSARVMKKSKNLEKRMSKEIASKEKLLKNIEKVNTLSMLAERSHYKKLLKFDNFSLGFDQTLFNPITLEVNQGEIVALTGVNGIGKSSLIKSLLGTFEGNMQGTVKIAHGIKISTVRQIYDNHGRLREFAEENDLDVELFLSNLRKLGMERSVFERPIETMSQGQQKKVELARSLSQFSQLYIWDEPLNYLDVFNHKQITQLLKKFQPTMLVVEHDQHFVKEVATKIIQLSH